MNSPILGSAYVTRPSNEAANKMVNLFPEVVPEGGKEPAFLARTPGLKFLTSVGTGPIKGIWSIKNYLYVVSGEKFYKVDSAYNVTYVGTVSASVNVSIVDNGTQIFIACDGDSYIYNINTGVFTQITNPDFLGAVKVGYIDSYFIFNIPNSQQVQISAQYDGLTYNASEVASAEGAPDGIVSLIVNNREVWIFGKTSTEIWYDSGAAQFPFERISGAFNEIGCLATFSVAKLDNSVFWLGCDNRGYGIVYRSNGYSAQRISTHTIEWQIQSYSNMEDAVAYTYQQEGHSFYVLNFPTADKTWVYDVATGAWHERASFSNGVFKRHRGNCQALYNKKIVIGDYDNGNIYSYDLETYSDNGSTQKWLRAWRALPTGTDTLKRTSHHSLQLDCMTGFGLQSGQGSDPKVMLRWSDDGGHTWSNEHWRGMGKVGKYGYRTYWKRLGTTDKLRDRVYEVSGTDPVPIYIMGAELDVVVDHS